MLPVARRAERLGTTLALFRVTSAFGGMQKTGCVLPLNARRLWLPLFAEVEKPDPSGPFCFLDLCRPDVSDVGQWRS